MLKRSLSLTALGLFGLMAACAPDRAEGDASWSAARDVPLALDPADPGRTAVGRLRYEAGFELRARSDVFGGLSGLLVAPDGASLTAVSDAGRVWHARLIHDPATGRLLGTRDWYASGIGRTEKEAGRGELDAESLARGADGSLVVGAEQHHGLRRVAAADTGALLARLPLPPGLDEAPGNGGLETLTDLPDGGFLAVAEELYQADGANVGWLLAPDGRAVAAFGYRPAPGYLPTDASRLGDEVYVLERRFSLLGGFRARVVRLDLDAIRHDGVVAGEELARLEDGLTVDNMEGIAARRAPDGGTLLYLVSDDNFMPFERTLLMQFRVADEASVAAARR